MSRRRHDYNGVRECSAVINCIVALVLAILGTVSILKYKGGHCEQVLHVPIVWVALAFAVISTILSCYADVGCLMCANGCCSCLFTIFLLCFCIFALSVTHKGGGDNLPGKAYKEYRLEDYSKWLQHKVNNTKMWTKIRKCLVRRHACKKMTRDWANITLQQFYTKRLSSIESGCCKPSNDCNFSYVSPTNWTTTANSTYTKPDCRVWNNDPNILCLDCQSCKAGVADKYKHNWFDGVQALT